MKIFPAIDILQGRCVRLTRGDYAQVTRYDDDPLVVARRFAAAGAEQLHVVDLDGAKQGMVVNRETILRIVAATAMQVQVGGGIRTGGTAAAYLDGGVHRIILGTAALETPDVLRDLVATWGAEHIAVSIDHREERILTHGWLKETACTPAECRARLRAAHVEWVILTDVARDGMLGAVSPAQLGAVRAYARDRFRVIGAGGVTSLDDIAGLRDAEAEGAIIGKALYERRIDLAEAIAAAKGGAA